MDIVIAGGGETGQALCEEFSHTINIVLIEKRLDLVSQALNNYDIEAIVGDADNVNIQVEARVGSSDIFIAVTDSDEVNIISCIIAKNLGSKHTIARIREPRFMESAQFIKDKVGVSHIINPNKESAKKIKEIINFEEADDIDYFIGGKLNLVAFTLEEDLDIIGKHLYQVDWKNENLLVSLIERGDDLIVPNGYTTLEANDRIYVTGDKKTITDFYKQMNIRVDEVRSVFIIGGSRTAYYLIKSLEKFDIDIKLIEEDYEKAEKLANEFPELIVIHGDGTDQDLLVDENIDYYDIILTLTGNDEENIMTSLFARHRGISKTITKINNNDLLRLLSGQDLGTSFNPKRILVDSITRIVRSMGPDSHSTVRKLYTIAGGKAIAVEFEVKEGNKWCQSCLKDLEIREGVLLAGICRDGEIIIPNGDFKVEPGDIAVIITKHTEFEELEGILENE